MAHKRSNVDICDGKHFLRKVGMPGVKKVGITAVGKIRIVDKPYLMFHVSVENISKDDPSRIILQGIPLKG